MCDIPLESSGQGLQLCFKPHHDWRSAQEVVRLQSRGSSSCYNFGTPTWEFRDKKPFGCGPHGEAQSLRGKVVASLESDVVSLVSPKSPVGRLSTKGVLESELTNLGLVGCKPE